MSRHDLWASYLDPEDTEAAPPEAEREALDRIRGVLADPSTWSEPPGDLSARVLALAALDEDTDAGTDLADSEGPTSPPSLAAGAGTDLADSDGTDLAAGAGTDIAAGADIDLAASADTDLAAGADTDLAAESGPDGAPGEPAVPGPDLRTLTGSGADLRPPGGAGVSAAEPTAGPEAGSRGKGPDAEGDGLAPVVPLGGARRRRWLVAAASGVAAAVAVVLALVLWPGGQPTAYPVAGTAAEPAASAMVTVDPRPAGVAITMRISGLPPSSDDTYYAVWLRGDAGTVPVGSFHWRKSGEPIDLWSGVDPSRYPTFFVTRQHEGAPPAPSTETVLQGVLKS